jgi:formylglycine-generating enzyme required for sulfatase activity
MNAGVTLIGLVCLLGADPPGPGAGSYRVIRGGSFGGPPCYCRAAYRLSAVPAIRTLDKGFRVVRVR